MEQGGLLSQNVVSAHWFITAYGWVSGWVGGVSHEYSACAGSVSMDER